MLHMSELPYPAIGQKTKKYILPDAILLTDQDGNSVTAQRGETVKLKQTLNFGWVLYNSKLYRY